MSVLKSFDNWKHFLGNRVNAAENHGMSEEKIANLAYEIGDFLANKIDPENKEERVLKDLWDAGDEQEQKTIAKLMVKMASKS
ncbi:DUF3243 domain-containing protein [Paenibacillus aurantius]|uniref:DUF3243 domain-containing protein n=1 Tax=Paenibacillus aurantius TaxID=2918900 RepID=A0AA96LGS0_9BACL|nr:DUF3243 domain-containing protein [Paenibacillus aurantius]WJH33307.1 DUF3243 domain-containing protein [Paenibacillus sp. CC-CFT747]WNQ13794.1 DUF3243 domain-containing protein [Paenibacillus aurantius]